MKRLVRLFPPEWRTRYGNEFEVLLEQERLSPTDIINIVIAALYAWQDRIPAEALPHSGTPKTAPRAGSGGGGIAMILAGGLAFLVTLLAPVPPAYGADRTLYNIVLLLIPIIPLLVNTGIAKSCLYAYQNGRFNPVLATGVASTTLGTGLLLSAIAARLLTGAENELIDVGYGAGFDLLLAGCVFYSAGMGKVRLLRQWITTPLLLTSVAGIMTLNLLQFDHYVFVARMHEFEWAMGFALGGSWVLVGVALLHSEKTPRFAAHA